MCYLDIKPTKTHRKIFYRFMLETESKNVYESFYVAKCYWKNKQLIAVNVKPLERNGHSYLKNFKGWSVFETIDLAKTAKAVHCSRNLRSVIVKVRCEGEAREAEDLLAELPCLIFDKMTILGRVRE